MSDFVIVSTASLKEHPQNREFFSDIVGSLWQDFLNDVRVNGITSPLTVNEKNEVVKGNQRLRAAKEIGIDVLPCIKVFYDDKEKELDDLIRDNVMRRDVDAFTKLTLVSRVLKRNEEASRQGERTDLADDDGTSVSTTPKLKPRDKTAKDMNISTKTVTAARRYNEMCDEDKEMLREWYTRNQGDVTSKKLNERIEEVYRLRNDLDKAREVISEYAQKEKKYQKYEELVKEISELQRKKGEEFADMESMKTAARQIDKARVAFESMSGTVHNVITSGREVIREEYVKLLKSMNNWVTLVMTSYNIKNEELTND